MIALLMDIGCIRIAADIPPGQVPGMLARARAMQKHPAHGYLLLKILSPRTRKWWMRSYGSPSHPAGWDCQAELRRKRGRGGYRGRAHRPA